MILALLATLWMWDFPCGEPIHHFRVEFAHVYQIGIQIGHDDAGEEVAMPIYVPWMPVLIQESLETMAMVPCAPLPGELCAIIVASVDDAGNFDEGRQCE